MLGLLLFISALAVLIICARMHNCHVLVLREKKKRPENLTGQ